MRTYSTIISLIFIVACANATKSVSYSDIVYSLMEVNQDTNTNKSLENFNKIDLSFKESKDKLEAWDVSLKKRCSDAQLMGVDKLQSQGTHLISLEKSKRENLEKQAAVRQAHEKTKALVTANMDEIKFLNEKIIVEKATFLENEKKRAERYMIYRRLISFVEDELTGNQRKTNMNDFNVDKNFSGKTAFVQFERIRSDLATISAKTADPMAKSMITTLLMLTQDSNKNLFVDPELVTKVKSLITLLMGKEYNSYLAEKEAFEKNTEGCNAIINGKTDEVDREKEQELMDVAEIAALEQAVRNIESEIKSVARAQEKQRKKNAIQGQMCQKQEDITKLHMNDLASFEAQFKDLKNNLA